MSSGPVVIKLAETAEEIQSAIDFMNTIAFEKYKCAPPPAPERIFMASNDTGIVGTMALDFGGISGILPLERIYKFNYNLTPWPFVRGQIAQFGRWMAKISGISIPLMYAATKHAIDKGKTYGLTEVKPYIHKRAAEIGIKLREIPEAVLICENIKENERGYYFTPPVSNLYMVELFQKEMALKSETIKAVQEKRVSFLPPV